MTHDFTVPHLICGHCVRAVTEAIQAVGPAATVQADPATRQVRVQSAQTRPAIVATLSEAGSAPAT